MDHQEPIDIWGKKINVTKEEQKEQIVQSTTEVTNVMQDITEFKIAYSYFRVPWEVIVTTKQEQVEMKKEEKKWTVMSSWILKNTLNLAKYVQDLYATMHSGLRSINLRSLGHHNTIVRKNLDLSLKLGISSCEILAN